MVPMLKFYFHDGVRTAAAESLPFLLECAKIKGPQYLQVWFESITKVTIERNQFSGDVGIHPTRAAESNWSWTRKWGFGRASRQPCKVLLCLFRNICTGWIHSHYSFSKTCCSGALSCLEQAVLGSQEWRRLSNFLTKLLTSIMSGSVIQSCGKLKCSKK